MRYRTFLSGCTGVGLALLLAGCNSDAVTTESGYANNSAEQAAAVGMSHGEYVARLGNCVACHSIEGGEPLAGGLKMAVPMLGAIYSTNITPDPEHGIGNYSFEDFDRAMRHGATPDGKRMYPAMPYTSYAKMSEQDMRALYDFLMNEVTPSSQPNMADEIPDWKNARWGMGIWNVMAHDDDPFEPDPAQSNDWNRGAYIIQGLGHCGACHTPRGLMMQEKGLNESSQHFLAGASLDNWYASALNGNINTGLGRWSEEDVAEFLGNGHNQFGTAFGTMVEVINNSSAHFSEDDLRGMAVYLKSLEASEDEGPTWEYEGGYAEAMLALNFEEPGSQVYYEYCSNCHGTDGRGYYPHQPPLAGNPVVLDEDPVSLVNLTLNGSLRVIAEHGPDVNDMPYFRTLLTDQEIAEALTFVRSAWGNSAPAVTESQVAELREMTDPVHNQDIFVLKMK